MRNQCGWQLSIVQEGFTAEVGFGLAWKTDNSLARPAGEGRMVRRQNERKRAERHRG